MKKHAGFTLIELLIVIAIAAVLTTLAVPSFTSFIQKKTVESQIHNIAGIFKLARSEALTLATPVSVSWDAVAGTITANRVDDNEVIGTAEFSTAGVNLVDSGNSPIQFSAQGRANQPASLALCANLNGDVFSGAITLLLTGRVSVVANSDESVLAC